MNEIIYREIRKSDHVELQQIICDSFGLHNYINNPRVLKNLLRMYLSSCLAECTFNRIAEKDGKVVGVIMGYSEHDKRNGSNIYHSILSIYHYMALTLNAARFKENASDYMNIQRIYRELIAGREKDFDGTVTLFAVTSNCRGLGVGKSLMQQLFEYFSIKNTKHIYVYTDSKCNYGFYDKHNFVRIGEKSLQVTSKGTADTLDVFLYELSRE